MDRRSFLWTPAAIAAAAPKGCDEMSSELEPWHMWGTSESVTARISTTGLVGSRTTQQLSKVSYHRPETWHFFLAAEIVSGPVLANTLTVLVNFQFIFGVGRAAFNSQFVPDTGAAGDEGFFARFIWIIPAGTQPGNQPGNKKFTTTVLSPVLEESSPTPDATRREIDSIVAQNINVNADVFAAALGVGEVTVRTSAFFAPKTHIRPDWFADDVEQFSGGQLGGT